MSKKTKSKSKQKPKQKKKDGPIAKAIKKVKEIVEPKPEGPKIVMNADGIPVCPKCSTQTIFKGHRHYSVGKGKKKESRMDRQYKCPQCGEAVNIPS